MTKTSADEIRPSPWSDAAKLLARWLEEGERVDALLESLPRSLSGTDRGRCQSLLFGAVRNLGRIEAHLAKLVERPPRARVKAVLIIAGFELIEGGDEHHVARVVHHAVEQTKTLASPAEARLVNAVTRKLAAALAAEAVPPRLAPAPQLAAYFSHPEWLVQRWLAQFGAEATRQLLEWNQQPSPVYARWRLREREPSPEELTWLTPTRWAGFYEVKQGHWPLVEAAVKDGRLYLQDPSTRISVELLELEKGEAVLDACAAPGGKSLLIADTLATRARLPDATPPLRTTGGPAGAPLAANATEATAATSAQATAPLTEPADAPLGAQADVAPRTVSAGRVVAVELEGPRVQRLNENLSRARGVDVALVQADITTVGSKLLRAHDLPTEYPAVLIDVPCSNTGVMRHRVDVKWRLQEGDFAKHARQQLALLAAASRLVAPGGRLVYSTCSLDAEENANVVGVFVEKSGGRFELERSELSRPWETGHDGAAAFLLKRK
jgi:16S rRNA (cytosine967-C5)-methyltransferase